MQTYSVLKSFEVGLCKLTVVHQRPAIYVEREEDSSALWQLLDCSEQTPSGFFYFVTGPPGGGKTTLAQRVIHEVRILLRMPHLK